MNCQEFWNTMPELSPGADHEHVRQCDACASRMARERELLAGLRAVSSAYQRVGAPGRVETGLRAAFRGQMGVKSAVSSRSAWRLVLPWAAAAAAVVVLALFLVRGPRSNAAPNPARRGAEMAMVVNSSEAQSDDDGFIALPNAGKLADTEDVNLVRVEVPRSAMLALGLEVSAERASELVQADVMIGPDGLARAVRFVDSDTL